MCHCWQFYFGKPGKYNYHNKQFSKKMDEIGLITSSTGKEGGAKLGKNMSHYINKIGLFNKSYKKLKSSELFPWVRNIEKMKFKPKPKKTIGVKTAYSCPKCGIKLWGKSSLLVLCINCNIRFIEE